MTLASWRVIIKVERMHNFLEIWSRLAPEGSITPFLCWDKMLLKYLYKRGIQEVKDAKFCFQRFTGKRDGWYCESLAYVSAYFVLCNNLLFSGLRLTLQHVISCLLVNSYETSQLHTGMKEGNTFNNHVIEFSCSLAWIPHFPGQGRSC